MEGRVDGQMSRRLSGRTGVWESRGCADECISEAIGGGGGWMHGETG